MIGLARRPESVVAACVPPIPNLFLPFTLQDQRLHSRGEMSNELHYIVLGGWRLPTPKQPGPRCQTIDGERLLIIKNVSPGLREVSKELCIRRLKKTESPEPCQSKRVDVM